MDYNVCSRCKHFDGVAQVCFNRYAFDLDMYLQFQTSRKRTYEFTLEESGVPIKDPDNFSCRCFE